MIVVVVAGLVIGGFYFVRDKIRPLQEASESRRQIVAELGAPETYVPPLDGAIAPDRMERSMDRVAWEDNLPRTIEESLQPYKSRLQSTYRSSTNCFELLTLEESSDHRWRFPERDVEIGTKRSEPSPAEAPPEVDATKRAEAGGSTLERPVETEVSYTVGNGVTAPVPIEQPAPAYTEAARSARVEGVMAIQAIVRSDGRLAAAKLVRRLGHGLDESALNTLVKDWRFKPGRLNGQPVDVPARIEITFRLK